MPERLPAFHACEDDARAALLATALALSGEHAQASGLTGCTRLSLRWGRSGAEGFLIVRATLASPGSTLDDIVWLALDDCRQPAGTGPIQERETLEPPAAWRLHQDIYRRRREVGAIIGSRPPFCTTLACLARVQRDGIPAFHPDVACVGGDSIRCAAHAPVDWPATAQPQAFCEHVAAALKDRAACLLAGRGLLATGATLRAAAELSAEVERLARIYWQVLCVEPFEAVPVNQAPGAFS